MSREGIISLVWVHNLTALLRRGEARKAISDIVCKFNCFSNLVWKYPHVLTVKTVYTGFALIEFV